MFQVKRFRKHVVTEQYRQIAAEVLHRVTNREAFVAGKLEPAAKVLRVEEKPVDEVPTLSVAEEEGTLAKVANE